MVGADRKDFNPSTKQELKTDLVMPPPLSEHKSRACGIPSGNAPAHLSNCERNLINSAHKMTIIIPLSQMEREEASISLFSHRRF